MHIPKHARRVYKGLLYDVYQWEQKLFDGTTEIFEGLKRKPSVQVVASVGNKIILLHEEQPNTGKFLSIPGGVLEGKEKPSDAARRELLEETGYEPGQLKFWKKHDFSADIQWDTYYFIAKNCRKIKNQQVDSGEKITIRLLSFEDFIKKVLSDKFRNKYFSNMIGTMRLDKKKITEFKKELLGSHN